MTHSQILKRSTLGNEITVAQRCSKCGEILDFQAFVPKCGACGGAAEYEFDGSFNGQCEERDDLWKNFDLIPVLDRSNIVALGAGGSDLIELPELSEELGGAQLFLKADSERNPTGTFKDREASIIISRCKELGVDDLVFYSTGNTGRAYTHFAAHLGLTTYFFMPVQCQYKNTAFIKRDRNFTILVDSHYPQIGPYAREFAKQNGLNAIAPLHDRTECYATLAYEQFQEMPRCDFFAQTIASGMGPIGFLRGHRNLVKMGLEGTEDVPRIVCIQSEETNAMYKAYSAGREEMTADDLPSEFPEDLFEPTLNSTNPVNNYPALRECLQESDGVITDVSPKDVLPQSKSFIEALQERGIHMRLDLEKSTAIGYAGLRRLADEGLFRPGQRIQLVATGRGRDTSRELIAPDLTIDPGQDDPVEVKRRLDDLVG